MKSLLSVLLTIVGFSIGNCHANAAYSFTPSAGAVFDSAAGIIPQAAPYTFSASAANDGVIAARSIPVAANTPYGQVSGTVKTAGILSKPAAAAMGKALMRLNLAVSVGSALYDVYQAANMPVDANGNPTVPSSVYSNWSWTATGGNLSSTAQGACDSIFSQYFGSGGYINGPATPSNAAGSIYNCNHIRNFDGYNAGDYVAAATSSVGSPVPATVAQKDAAIDTYANASSANALQLASDAYAAKIDLPNISVVGPQSQPAVMLSPWVEAGMSIDANGNKLITYKQAQIDIAPSTDPLATTASPLPIRITENTRVDNSVGVPQSSSTSLVAKVATGTSPAASVVSPSAAAPAITFPTDYNREATQNKIADALGVTPSGSISDTEAQDITTLTGDSGGIPTFDKGGLSGNVSLPAASGSCKALGLKLGGVSFDADPCPLIAYVHPLINYLFVILFGILCLRTAFKNDELGAS
jgi:hypothetical protein